jgi:hypothetical protein
VGVQTERMGHGRAGADFARQQNPTGRFIFSALAKI